MSDTSWQLQRGVISVVRTRSAETALTLARGIARTAVPGIEVTMTVPGAIEVIATLTGEGVVGVGAGTVRTIAQLEGCIDRRAVSRVATYGSRAGRGHSRTGRFSHA
jgi:2-keto-3-deoxy-6-phosphogluconate aldolase